MTAFHGTFKMYFIFTTFLLLTALSDVKCEAKAKANVIIETDNGEFFYLENTTRHDIIPKDIPGIHEEVSDKPEEPTGITEQEGGKPKEPSDIPGEEGGKSPEPAGEDGGQPKEPIDIPEDEGGKPKEPAGEEGDQPGEEGGKSKEPAFRPEEEDGQSKEPTDIPGEEGGKPKEPTEQPGGNPEPEGGDEKSEQGYSKAALVATNKRRKMEVGDYGGKPDLVTDEAICKGAREYAKKLGQSGNCLVHTDTVEGFKSENLHQAGEKIPADAVVKSWYDEKTQPGCVEYACNGHYQNMVDADITKMCMAVDNGGGKYWCAVARYG